MLLMPIIATNMHSSMGTIISQKHLERIEAFVQKHSDDGILLAGGRQLQGLSPLDGYDYSRGAFFPPTVFADVGTDSPLWQEEIFGPVVVVKRFSVCISAYLYLNIADVL
jgi:acyl-CoA reductase-like NAD-dependent aldehyde dehydrogenase